MVRTRSLEKSTSNFTGSSSRASAAYKDAVGMVSNWQSQAVSDAAETNYGDAVSAAVAAKRRQRALQLVSNSDWQTAAQGKGATNIQTGIRDGGTKYNKGEAPFLAAIQAFDLPAKSLDAATNYDNRAKALGLMLAAKKKELKG